MVLIPGFDHDSRWIEGVFATPARELHRQGFGFVEFRDAGIREKAVASEFCLSLSGLRLPILGWFYKKTSGDAICCLSLSVFFFGGGAGVGSIFRQTVPDAQFNLNTPHLDGCQVYPVHWPCVTDGPPQNGLLLGPQLGALSHPFFGWEGSSKIDCRKRVPLFYPRKTGGPSLVFTRVAGR